MQYTLQTMLTDGFEPPASRVSDEHSYQTELCERIPLARIELTFLVP